MKTVLVVDDEFAIAEVLGLLLSDEGYRVETAFSGQEALERLAQSPPDLVLSDVMMPGIDGVALARAMREMPEYRAIPVVLMSAGPPLAPADGEYAAFLRKPFDAITLLDTVSRLLDHGGGGHVG